MAKKERINKERFYRKLNMRIGQGIVPVGIISMSSTATKIGFHNGCPKCYGRLKKKDFCPACNKEVAYENIVKTYDQATETPLVFSKEEIKSINAEVTKNIVVIGTGDITKFNPLLVGKTYAVLPNLDSELGSSDKNYCRLLYAMRTTKRYLVVNWGLSTGGTATSYKAVMFYHKDESTRKEFMLLCNLKTPKEIQGTIFYEPQQLSETEIENSTKYMKTLKETPLSELADNEVEKKKQELITAKIEAQSKGEPLQIKVVATTKPKDTDIFAQGSYVANGKIEKVGTIRGK